MKKIAFLLVAILYLQSSFAQDYKPVRLSFVINPQVSWLKSDNASVESGGSLFGYNFGVVVDRFFTPNYALSTGLTVNTTGGVLKYSPAVNAEIGGVVKENISKLNYRLKYIEIPIALKLRSNDFNRMAYYGQFGLSWQFSIKTSDGTSSNIDPEVRLFDLGYHFGGGIEYSIGGSNYLMIGGQFNNGFSDITNNASITDKAILNRFVFQFGLVF